MLLKCELISLMYSVNQTSNESVSKYILASDNPIGGFTFTSEPIHGAVSFDISIENNNDGGDNQLVDGIKVSPNPAQEFLIIELTPILNCRNYQLEICDLSGKPIINQTGTLYKVSNLSVANFQLRTDDGCKLSKGIYFGKITYCGVVKEFKFVKD